MFKLLNEAEGLAQDSVGTKAEPFNLLEMGSKRTKKTKQDPEIFAEKNEENGIPEPEVLSEVNNAINPNPITPSPKAPKRRRKSQAGGEVPKKVKKTNNENEVKKVRVRKKKEVKPQNGEIQKTVKHDSPVKKKEELERKKEDITWPEEDILELINKIETIVPENDAMAYRSRVEKLSWEKVTVKNYTPDECKKTWLQVQKRIRRFRLLKEILHDAKEWVATPKNHKLPRPKKHPDMPRRPLSSYLLFYLKEKDDIVNEHPGLIGSDLTRTVGQIYKNLPPERKEKYEQMAATNREEYLQKLKLFFDTHPEFIKPQRFNANFKEKSGEKEKTVKLDKKPNPVPIKVKATKAEKSPKMEKSKPPRVVKVKTKSDRRPGRPPRTGAIERPPKKYQTPFGLYFTSEMKNMEPGADKIAFRDKCKLQYQQMPDNKKVVWINLAEQDLRRYQEEAKAYKLKYPGYKPVLVKSVLTKREKASKERAAGKPRKPANSAYALFSRVMLQSDEIKTVHPKDRMNYIASKWKTCTEEEQNSYKDQVVQLLENYKREYQNYVDSLPEEERRKILQPKPTRNGRTGKLRSPKKRKSAPKVQPPKMKFSEPEQPPISACKYFASLYKGEGNAAQAWKALSAEEKRKYEDELVKKKQAYIVEFEKFLKSLSKEELEAFSKSRQQQVQSDDEGSSDCSSGSDAEDEDEDEEDDEQNDGQIKNEEHESDSE